MNRKKVTGSNFLNHQTCFNFHDSAEQNLAKKHQNEGGGQKSVEKIFFSNECHQSLSYPIEKNC